MNSKSLRELKKELMQKKMDVEILQQQKVECIIEYKKMKDACNEKNIGCTVLGVLIGAIICFISFTLSKILTNW